MAHQQQNKSGMTLAEVLIAVAITSLICGGLYKAGIAMFRMSQTNRVLTEAHAFCNAGIEDVYTYGYDYFRGGNVPAKTNVLDVTTHNVEIIRTTEALLRDSTGNIITNGTGDLNGYAEVHVSVKFNIPGTSRQMSSTISTILTKDDA